jgi:hypothetical protein
MTCKHQLYYSETSSGTCNNVDRLRGRISLYRVSQKSFNSFARSYPKILWYYRNDIGAKKCVQFSCFVRIFMFIISILI